MHFFKTQWILCFGITSIFLSFSRAQEYEWVKTINGADLEFGNAVGLDPQGNVYSTGYFSGTVDFDSGPGTTNITSTGSLSAYIVKHDITGDLIWATSVQGPSGSSVQGAGIKIDPSGNIYVIGTFSGTIDFDPSPLATVSATSNGGNDFFILKLDPTGNYIWVQTFGGLYNEAGTGITIDPTGNVYATGYYRGTVDFDPSGAVSNLTSNGTDDFFILKLTTNGDHLWSKTIGGTSTDQANAITTDNAGNVLVTGSFANTVDFDPNAGVTNLTSFGGFGDVFVLKIDPNGDFVWAKQMGGTASDIGRSISSDASGNVYATGSYQGVADFDPSVGTLQLTSAVATNNAFILKLDSNGNLDWAKSIGDAGSDQGLGIHTDASGNVFAQGMFSGAVDFDPNGGSFPLTSSGTSDMYILKLDASGDFVWVKSVTSVGSGITVDSAENIYVTGYYVGTVDFDPGTGVSNASNLGGIDAYLLKLSIPLPLPAELIDFNAQRINDFTQLNWSTASERNTDFFVIERSLDAVNWYEVLQVKALQNTTIKSDYAGIDYSQLDLGTTFYRLKIVDLNGSTNYSEVISLHAAPDVCALYPNPSTDEYIYLTGPSDQLSQGVTITNSYGQLIQCNQSTLTKNQIRLDLSTVPSGIYYVQINKQRIKMIKL